jgi:hypothetical protein
MGAINDTDELRQSKLFLDFVLLVFNLIFLVLSIHEPRKPKGTRKVSATLITLSTLGTHLLELSY